jgi:hypothetical protein
MTCGVEDGVVKGATLRLGSARRCRRCASEAVTGDDSSHVGAIACAVIGTCGHHDRDAVNPSLRTVR